MAEVEPEDRGRVLKELREAAGLRREQMAVALEVSTRTIENYELGRTKVPKAVEIAWRQIVKSRCNAPSELRVIPSGPRGLRQKGVGRPLPLFLTAVDN